jgi:hypothetical protein
MVARLVRLTRSPWWKVALRGGCVSPFMGSSFPKETRGARVSTVNTTVNTTVGKSSGHGPIRKTQSRQGSFEEAGSESTYRAGPKVPISGSESTYLRTLKVPIPAGMTRGVQAVVARPFTSAISSASDRSASEDWRRFSSPHASSASRAAASRCSETSRSCSSR